ncbi:hypothetical protein H9Y04_38730 [Streptomyces sp. TRM66268-LWL]|uniref:Integral membrane protein n=1 Tax=Streptomyces polyasparticus TaxID=2767826 RepID=A0ABR7SSK3_9ACTN|nr:hypothetical protein [Streptomyces polyasparticus]MBC9718477.1 hypothetical protein [Streptomyces polyasparticus]
MSGPLRLLPGDGNRQPHPYGDRRDLRDLSGANGLPHLPRKRSGRTRPSWAADAVDELAERLAEQIAVAVHPDEVAALLESDGLTAERIEQQYGRSDLFTLAEDLFDRVPRHYASLPPGPDPWRADPLRCALRGLAFALPGLAYVLGAQLLRGHPDLTGLVAAALFAWAWNQGLSHRAYLRLSAEGPAGAARALRVGVPVGALLSGGLGLALAGPTTAGAFAVGQSVYLGAASALLVLGRERALLIGLLPVVAGAGATLLWPLPAAVVLGVLLGSVALTAAVAWHALREALPPGGSADARTRAPGVLSSVPYGLFGLAAGVLAALAGALDARTVVVLTLSMGFAEWLLYRYRSLGTSGLRSSTDLPGFTDRSGRALALCLGAYLALLAGGALVAGTEPLALFLLGTVFWTALLLQAFSVAWFPALVSLAAAAAQAAARAAELPDVPAQLICTGLAAVVLTVGTCRLLSRPTAHR